MFTLMLNMHSERIFNRIDPHGLATGNASECNEIKLPYISKIPCGLAAGFFIKEAGGHALKPFQNRWDIA